MDKVLQIEFLLNMINTLFAKSACFKDYESIDKLNAIRHQIYYADFDYNETINELKKLSDYLKKYV